MFQNLPNELNVAPGIRKGRVPRDGYQRGWGLQFGSLRQLVENEDLFKRSLARVGLRSLIIPEKRANLYLILTRFLTRLPDRNVIEFGSYKGGNAIFMALVLQEVAPEAKVYALDTYGGMPATDKSIDAHNAGDFADTSLDELNRRIGDLRLKNLVPVKGLFQETFPCLAVGEKFGLAHIDADIYSAIKYAQDAVWPRMTKGGYVVYDDADFSSCIGATQAVEELIQERKAHSEQIWPHFVFRAGLDDSFGTRGEGTYTE
jgi:predicted O-methyltransferase YrrM